MKPLPTLVAAAAVALVLVWPALCQAQHGSAAPGSPAPTAATSMGDAVGRGAKATAPGIERGPKAAEHGIKVGPQAAAHGVEAGALASARAASDLAKKIKLAPDSRPGAGT